MYLMISSMIHKVLTHWGCYVCCVCAERSLCTSTRAPCSRGIRSSRRHWRWAWQMHSGTLYRTETLIRGAGGGVVSVWLTLLWFDWMLISILTLVQFYAYAFCILTVDLHACSFAYSYWPLICMHAHLHIHIDRWFACMLICIFISQKKPFKLNAIKKFNCLKNNLFVTHTSANGFTCVSLDLLETSKLMHKHPIILLQCRVFADLKKS